MNILLLGSGGREHALAWKMAQSPLCGNIYIAPGNAGTAILGENLPIDPCDFDAIAAAVKEKEVGLLVVGPEAPLVEGIRDYFESRKSFAALRIVGPGKVGAQLEGSKDFAKAFMARHNIPTARYGTFTKDTLAEAKAFLHEFTPPYVLKADGLAAGKGVLIVSTLPEAEAALDDMLAGAKFGSASAKVVIEAFLSGIELSVFALTDGKDFVLLPEAKDYKRIGEGDTGLNTGGMGAVSPVLIANEPFMAKVRKRIVAPTIEGLQAEGIPYVGFVFFGLINVKGEPYVIEYNARMGDPETEAVVPRIDGDLLELLVAAAEGRLKGKSVQFDPRSTATVVMVSGGYPGAYAKGKEIKGLDTAHEALVFHAGTVEEGGKVKSAGGRVLAVTAYGKDLDESLKLAYAQVHQLHFSESYVRNDIGLDLQQ
jgi:phosphoribosylamine--glycine ligase